MDLTNSSDPIVTSRNMKQHSGCTCTYSWFLETSKVYNLSPKFIISNKLPNFLTNWLLL